jgi:hypothetical protein
MRRPAPGDDRGSTIPLILGCYLIAFLFVAGAVLASDVFNRQRALQSVCDGAAIAASNAVDPGAARATQLGSTLPLEAVQQAVTSYLRADPARAGITAVAQLGADGRSVQLACTGVAKVAFGAVIGRGAGVTQHATSTAQGRLD